MSGEALKLASALTASGNSALADALRKLGTYQ